MGNQLSGEELLRLRDALCSAFLRQADFDELLLALDKSLDALCSARDPYPTRVLAVIKQAESRDWLPALVAKAREQKPLNPSLRLIEDKLKVIAITVPPTTTTRDIILDYPRRNPELQEVRAGFDSTLDTSGHLVVLVHGINTRALWMSDVKPALE